MHIWCCREPKSIILAFPANFFLSGVGVGKKCVLPAAVPTYTRPSWAGDHILCAKDFGIPAGRLETAKKRDLEKSLGA